MTRTQHRASALVVAVAALAIALGGAVAPASADATTTLTVTVVSGAGVPLTDMVANVMCASNIMNTCESATTDANGVAVIAGVPASSSVTLSVWARFNGAYTWANFGTTTVTLDTTAVASTTVTMADAHVVTGRFTGGGSAQVTSLTALESAPTGPIAIYQYMTAVITGESFVIVDSHAPYIDQNPFYWVLAAKSLTSYSGGTVYPALATPVSAVSNLVIDVPTPTGTITGRFVDRSGRPIVGASVLGAPLGQNPAVTDSNGAFRLTGLWKGRYRPMISGYSTGTDAQESVVLADGASADVGTIAVSPTAKSTAPLGRISGVVKDPELWTKAQGSGQAAFWKKWVPAVSVIGADGRDWTYRDSNSLPKVKTTGILTARQKFTVAVPAGVYFLSTAGTSVYKRVVVKAGKTTTVAITRPKTTGRITGIVNGSDGKPLKNARVIFDGPGLLKAATDSKGRFTSPDLLPGRYVVTTQYTGEVRTNGELNSYDPPFAKTVVTIPAKLKKHKKVVKKIAITQPAVLTYAGTVVTASGAPVSGVNVVLSRSEAEASACQGQWIEGDTTQTTTTADGRFSISTPLGTGTYYAAACPFPSITDGLVATRAAYPVVLTASMAGVRIELQ